MLGVCSACLAAMARGGAADPKQSALRGDAEAMPHPRENGCFPGLWQEGRTTLGLNSALPGRLWLKIKIRCDGPQRKAQRFAHVCARAKTSGLPLPLTREPPRRRRIKATRFHCSTPTF